jgi:uncharacterized protein YaiE (UPF0345 family)
MSKTTILTSLHGRRVGLNAAGRLVVSDKLVPSLNAAGGLEGVQAAPGTLNATGTLTATLLTSGIITSTTASAVTATLATGAALDAAVRMAVDDAFDWAVINTGPNTFTVAASSGHTIVGAAAVATSTSARFRTRKTAANTFVTYRL